MGVPLRQLYGQTELLGAYTLHPAGEVDLDTVGVPFDDDIEIRDRQSGRSTASARSSARHPNMFLGYYKNQEATRRRPARTAGCIPAMPATSTPAGQLVVIDRIKDLATPRAASASRRNTSRTS